MLESRPRPEKQQGAKIRDELKRRLPLWIGKESLRRGKDADQEDRCGMELQVMETRIKSIGS